METQHQAGKQPEKAQKFKEEVQPFAETTPLLPSQMALANPNPNTLTPAAINVLQRTHGNRYVTNLVQRRRLTQSPPFLIRRRVPESGDIDDEALETPNAGANAANIEGLRTLLRRVVQDMEASLRSQFLSARVDGGSVAQVIETGNSDQLLALIREMERDPQLQPYILTTTTQTFVTPRQSHDFTRVRAVVEDLHRQLTAIGTTATHDEHLRRVFGDDPQYGWQQAKARFPHTANEMRRAFRGGDMGADRTGNPEQVGLGGLTSFGDRLMVRAEYIDNPDTVEAKRGIVHESFHFAFDDVRDEGGYTRDEAFRRASAQTKFTNAEHYAEVFLRSIGQGDGNRRYVPTTASTARTPNELAHDDAATKLRRAWDASLDVHNFIRDCYNRQQRGGRLSREQAAALLHHSHLYALTYHQRHSGLTTPVNEIDIALAEGVSRRLDAATRVIAGASLPDNPLGWPLTRDDYITNALTGAGIIVRSTARDLTMVKYMSELFDDLPSATMIRAWFMTM